MGSHASGLESQSHRLTLVAVGLQSESDEAERRRTRQDEQPPRAWLPRIRLPPATREALLRPGERSGVEDDKPDG